MSILDCIRHQIHYCSKNLNNNVMISLGIWNTAFLNNFVMNNTTIVAVRIFMFRDRQDPWPYNTVSPLVFIWRVRNRLKKVFIVIVILKYVNNKKQLKVTFKIHNHLFSYSIISSELIINYKQSSSTSGSRNCELASGMSKTITITAVHVCNMWNWS